MRAYRAAWRAGCSLFAGVGVVIAVLVVPLSAWLVVAMAAAVSGVLLFIAGNREEHRPSSEREQHPARWTARVAAAGYVIVMTALGLGVVLEGGVLLIAMLLVATSPTAIASYVGRRRPSAELQQPDIPISELCREWLDTYDALKRASSSQARLRIVMRREHCLDELERRDPDGLHAWLASTASAGGNPRRFLTGRADT